MDTAQRKKHLAKIKKSLEQSFSFWEKEQSLKDSKDYIAKWLNVVDDTKMIHVADSLQTISWIYMANATYRIVLNQADKSDFDSIWTAYNCAIAMWQAELAYNLKLNKHYEVTTLEFNTVLHHFALSIVFDESNWINAFNAAMYGYQDKGAFFENVCADLPFATFIHTLANRVLGFDVKSNTNTQYDRVIEMIDNSPDKLKETVEELLDHQLIAACGGKGLEEEHMRYYPEICFSSAFAFRSAMLLPSHVMLIHKYCLLNDITFPEIEHPLYPQPFIDLVEGNFERHLADPLYEQVIEQVFKIKEGYEKNYPERIYVSPSLSAGK